jgi:hypothetical protein
VTTPGESAEWPAALVEGLAVAYHRLYRETFPGEPLAAVEWDELPEHLRESNRTTARELPEELASLGYLVRQARGDGRAVEDLPAQDLEVLAQREHVRWVRDKAAEGYVHGPERDDGADPPTHPDLVDFDDLDDTGRFKDRIRFEAAPRLLAELGYEIVRNP